MSIIWESGPIQIRDELHVDVKASDSNVTLGTFNDAVQAIDLVLSPEQAMALADALTEGAARCLAAREG
jgi:hypothetical protein